VNVIEVRDLSKDYRQHFWTPKRRVLHGVSFDVREKEIFGFLGPNGAGKSTTIKILLEIIFPTAGTARILGRPSGDREAKRQLGFLPENPYFYDFLSATQFLQFHGGLCGLSPQWLKNRIPEVLEQVGMKGTELMSLRSFSKGMMQRIGIAQALLHDPKLVILDEPMTGLDPLGRREVRDLMLRLREAGKTVFFSTHILSDVESICDRVAILNKGRLLSCGALSELISVEMSSVDIAWSELSDSARQNLRQLQAVKIISEETGLVRFDRHPEETTEAFQKRMNEMVQWGLSQGASLVSFQPRKESLEDVFVRQVGNLESRV
jgi:ABC-2 type transport system ATP-binding protein